MCGLFNLIQSNHMLCCHDLASDLIDHLSGEVICAWLVSGWLWWVQVSGGPGVRTPRGRRSKVIFEPWLTTDPWLTHNHLCNNTPPYTTGLHIKKAYTSLGTSSPNAYTKSYCCLLMHVCISMEMSLNAYTTTCWYTHCVFATAN